MIIKSLGNVAGFEAGDASFLRELLHPGKEPLAIGCSLAHAAVESGATTLPHRLKSAEVYYVLEGRGRMHIGSEQAEVGPGDAVYIPPGAVQFIANAGPGRLSFLCIVEPAWTPEDEEVL
ncbi:MAG TPA: cupin domain-containing protein [Acidobacteriota bacterium]|nr:cupin domain-containing protein [Acidobacteriota bacterium]